MRPPVDIPDPAIIIFGGSISLICFDSSAVSVNVRLGNLKMSSPEAIISFVCLLKKVFMLFIERCHLYR